MKTQYRKNWDLRRQVPLCYIFYVKSFTILRQPARYPELFEKSEYITDFIVKFRFLYLPSL